jgi:uncharacterized membrane-anchored protein YitT (DUF2179 family)
MALERTQVEPEPVRHRFYEDVLALLIGTVLVSIGLTLYAEATLATSGVAGLALLLQYAAGVPFALGFFLLNLPFFVLAVRRLGWPFALRTVAAIALVALLSRLTPHWLAIASLDPLYAALAGGCLVGMGLLALFRHRAGLGGFNILAVFLQDAYGLRAGYSQLALDSAVLLVALFTLPPAKVAMSLGGAVVLNLILAFNHRPGRYLGIS